jgi:hypothetical protein
MRSIDPAIAPQGNCPARQISIPKGSSGAVFDGWARPADWLALPLLATTDQIFAGLFAVYNTAHNYVTLKCSGAYAVDWGDGSALETVATGTTVTHDVAWANVSDGTITTSGYKQVIITCTPQAGQAFSSIDVTQKPAGTTSGQTSQWLDISVEMNNTGVFAGFYAPTYPNSLLQGFRWYGTNTLTTAANYFYACSALRQSWINADNCQSTAYMYYGCSGATSFPLINTAASLSTAYMYQGCSGATSFPLINTAASVNTTAMYYGCSGATSFPLINTAASVNTTNMYYNCAAATSFPLINTAASVNTTNMYQGCAAALAMPALNLSASIDNTSMHGANTNLYDTDEYGSRFSISYASCKLPKAVLEKVFTNLGSAYPGATRTITVTSNAGNDTVISRSAGTTTGSAVVTQTNTASLATGMLVSGPGISDAVAVTFTDVGDLVNRTAHGLANGKEVSFATIVTTTGIVIYTRYYVVNQSADNFQVSLTLGGSPIELTTDGSGILLYGSFIQSIVPNTSITLDAPASATGTITAVHSILDTSKATLKGWQVSR